MSNIAIDFCGINSPNPFWLASAPPTNSGEQIMRAFDIGWEERSGKPSATQWSTSRAATLL